MHVAGPSYANSKNNKQQVNDAFICHHQMLKINLNH